MSGAPPLPKEPEPGAEMFRAVAEKVRKEIEKDSASRTVENEGQWVEKDGNGKGEGIGAEGVVSDEDADAEADAAAAAGPYNPTFL